MSTQTYSGTLALEHCCTCGVPFGVPAAYQRKRREDHGWFYCPNGHPQHYTAKSEAEKLRDQLAKEKHHREQSNARLQDLTSTMSGDLRVATEQAKRYRHSRAQLGAFWKGYESRGCALPSDCPYSGNRGGFRAAWFRGAGIDDDANDGSDR